MPAYFPLTLLQPAARVVGVELSVKASFGGPYGFPLASSSIRTAAIGSCVARVPRPYVSIGRIPVEFHLCLQGLFCKLFTC